MLSPSNKKAGRSQVGSFAFRWTRSRPDGHVRDYLSGSCSRGGRDGIHQDELMGEGLVRDHEAQPTPGGAARTLQDDA